jgi:hypothetical protein
MRLSKFLVAELTLIIATNSISSGILVVSGFAPLHHNIASRGRNPAITSNVNKVVDRCGYGNISTEKYLNSNEDENPSRLRRIFRRRLLKRDQQDTASGASGASGAQEEIGQLPPVDPPKPKPVTNLADVLIGGLKNDSTKKYFKEIDDYATTILIIAGTQQLMAGKDKAKTSEDFKSLEDLNDKEGSSRFDYGWQKQKVESSPCCLDGVEAGLGDWEQNSDELVTTTDNVTNIKRISHDVFFGTSETTDLTKIPLKDKIIYFNSEEERATLVQDLNLNGISTGGCSPDPYKENDWGEDKSSDENFTRFFFHGIGAVLLEQQTKDSSKPDLGPIEIDLDFMKDLVVRDGFRRHGVKIFFDCDQKSTGIYDSSNEKMFFPGDDGWEGAKFLARASAFTLMTAREHLFQTHLLCSNYFSLASITHLPPIHPLRRLINVFTFRTNYVNDQAFSVLVPENSTLHRAVPYKFGAMLKIFKNSFQNSNVWQPFPQRNMRPELLEMSSNGKLPYHSEAVEYYKIVEEFVREWIRAAGENYATDKHAKQFYDEIRKSTVGQKYSLPEFTGIESTVDVLTQSIFVVTCYHEIVGTLIDYTNDISFGGFRVGKDDEDGNACTEKDVQGFLFSNLLTASTGLQVPMLMKPYKNYFSQDGAPEWEAEQWNKFQASLEAQSKKVKESRTKDDIQFLSFDPKRFESAVSV